MSVATNREDGWPQATIVGYANDGLIIYCFIGHDSQKYANIMRDPRISIAIANDYPQPLMIKGLSMAAGGGSGGFRRDRSRHRDPLPALSGVQGDAAADPAAVPRMRITPELVSILDYSKGFGHTDLVRVTDNDLAEYLESRRHHWAGYKAA